MKSSRWRFGPLFYGTCVVAALLLISRPFWQMGAEQFRAWRLVGQLRDPRESSRRQAADGLVQLGPAARPWVLRAMRDGDAQVRRRACSILVRTALDCPEEALAALRVAAKDSDPAVQVNAVDQLELFIIRYGSAPETDFREKALRALGDGSPQVRRAAAWVFWNLGPTARSAVGDLDRALDGPDKSVRVIVGQALLRLDKPATRSRVVTALSPMLTDQSIRLDHFRLVRVLILAQGEEPTAAMIIPLLKHPDLATRIQALNDLVTQCGRAKALRPVMIEALASDDGGMREDAAFFLLEHENRMASRALDTLVQQIADPLDGGHGSWELVERMRRVPYSLYIKSFVSRLVELLHRAPKPANRANIITALGEVGPLGVSAVPALRELSNSDDPEIATRAAAALRRIDPATERTLRQTVVAPGTPGSQDARPQ